MDSATLATHGIFLLATAATLLGTAFAVRWRARRLAACPAGGRPGIDPVVNAFVRGGAALLLVLVVGWVAATANSPRQATESGWQGDRRCGAHSWYGNANENEKVQR